MADILASDESEVESTCESYDSDINSTEESVDEEGEDLQQAAEEDAPPPAQIAVRGQEAYIFEPFAENTQRDPGKGMKRRKKRRTWNRGWTMLIGKSFVIQFKKG